MKYLKYIVGVLIVLVPCVVTVLIYNDKITENSPQYYKQGVEFYDKGDYSNAYYNFGKISKISPLYAISLYKQAKSAQKVGDYKMAALKYDLFLKKVPHSLFTTTATLNLGKSYYYSKQFDEAQTIFEKLNNKTNNDGTEEVYFLGLIAKEKGESAKAVKYLSSYLETAFEKEALNKSYILKAAEELSAYDKLISDDDKRRIGIAYFKNAKYKKALECFSKLPINICWDYFVLSNHYAGNKVVSKKLIETGFPVFGKDADKENLKLIYDAYASYLSGSKLKNWSKVYQFAKENNLAGFDYVLYKLAGMVPENNALSLYSEIVNNYADGDYAPEAEWHLFWNKYTNGKYVEAEDLAIKHLNSFKRVKSTPRMMFWLAKTCLRENKMSEAHSYFSKLISKYPDDYYGLRAANILEKKNDFWSTNPNDKIPQQKENIEFPIITSNLEMKDLKLINTLFDMGDYEVWLDADFSNPVVESWFELKKNKKAHSILLVRNALEDMEIKPPFASATYKLAYPRYYVDEINKYASQTNINPYLVMALVREESYFNEHAKSPQNATGLMQLMPETAKYVVSNFNIDTASLGSLEDVDTNLLLGCNYLAYLKERFNNEALMIAAYNGGEGAVLKLLKNNKSSDNDEFIENIPMAETRNYVKKVFRSYHMYKKIYK